MGRGPGRWQRLILEALETQPVVSVTGLAVQALGRPLTPAEYAAVTRAAHTLAQRGRSVLVRTLCEDATGRTNVVLLACTREAAAHLPEEIKVNSVRKRTDSTNRSARIIPGSIRHIAREVRMPKSTVWEDIFIGRSLAPDVKERLRGTPLANNRAVLLKLARLDPEAQRRYVAALLPGGERRWGRR